MTDELSLPTSSYVELVKIIRGYSHGGENLDLASLSKLVGISTTSISGNNKFLADVGLIQGGKKKSATPLGKRLGRALEHNQTDELAQLWAEAVGSNEKLANIVTTVRIKGGIAADDLLSHILYVAGKKNTPDGRTGARTLVDILLNGGLLTEKDGKLQVAAPASGTPQLPSEEPTTDLSVPSGPSTTPTGGPSPARTITSVNTTPTIAINIELQLPATDNAEVYDKLFAALKKHLFPSATEDAK